MKPLSARPTPGRLMAPISRHFLRVLQPEPPAWLTTGLMKGSRLPFAAYLPSGTTCSSLAAPSALPELLWAALAAAGGLLFGTVGAGFACALRPATTPTRFATPVLFVAAELAAARGEVEEDFTGVTTATPRGLAGACVALAGAGTGADW